MSNLRLILALLPAVALSGCVERILEVRSEPSGAAVYADGEHIGETPHTLRYAHYGTREITLVKAGYKTHRKRVDLNTPWYQIFPLDLITDVVIPFTIRDKVKYEVTLEKEPEKLADFDQVLKRAKEAREKAEVPADGSK